MSSLWDGRISPIVIFCTFLICKTLVRLRSYDSTVRIGGKIPLLYGVVAFRCQESAPQ